MTWVAVVVGPSIAVAVGWLLPDRSLKELVRRQEDIINKFVPMQFFDKDGSPVLLVTEDGRRWVPERR